MSSFGWHVDSIEDLQRLLHEAGSDATVPAFDLAQVAEKKAQPASPTSSKRTEHEEQVMLFKRAQELSYEFPELSMLFAIPNGAKLPYHKNAQGDRVSVQGAILKAEGLRAGVPDLMLACARFSAPLGGVPLSKKRFQFLGLFVEMKTAKGKVSDLQVEWIFALRQQGYACIVARGYEAALDAILRYLRHEMTVEEGLESRG